MLQLRSVAMILGLAVVAALATKSSAATPEEQAAFREEARQLTEQARAQEAQADAARELAKQIFIAEFKKADGVDDQADTKKIAALQKWLQGGVREQARVFRLRESARSLLLAAYQFETRALLVDEQAANERSRATRLREAADALLGTNPDAETRAIARELNRRANENDQDGEDLEDEAEELRKRADSKTERAEFLIQKAVQLETASASEP